MKVKKRYSNGGSIDYNSGGTSAAALMSKDRRTRRRNRRQKKSDDRVSRDSCGPGGCEAAGPSRGGSLATRDAGVSREEKKATRKANREDRRAERRKPKGNLMVVSTGSSRRRRRRSRADYGGRGGSGIGLFGPRSSVKQGVREAKRQNRKNKRSS